MLPSSRLIQEELPNSSVETTTPRNLPTAPLTLSSAIIDVADGNDDDPPPYSAVVPPNHVGWPFDFPRIPYSTCSTTSGRMDMTPLAGVQPGLTSSSSSFHPEGRDGQPPSISMPSVPYRVVMLDSRPSSFAHGGLPYPDNISVNKGSHGNRHRYGAILIGAAVIIFLMALSLLVRFVVDKNFWRG